MRKYIGYTICLLVVCMLTACADWGSADREDFTVKIVNASSEKIYAIGYTYYINEKISNSGGVCNADNSAIKNGDDIVLENIPDAEVFGLELFVEAENGEVYSCFSKMDMESGKQYVIQIIGDFEDGFETRILSNFDEGYFGFDI